MCLPRVGFTSISAIVRRVIELNGSHNACISTYNNKINRKLAHTIEVRLLPSAAFKGHQLNELHLCKHDVIWQCISEALKQNAFALS